MGGFNLLDALKEKGAALRLRLFNKWQQFREAMRHKRRLVVLDADTLEEKHSFELTGANLFTAVTLVVIVLLLLAALLIAVTPLRGIIPGYVSPELMEQSYANTRAIDSLERVVDAQDMMIANIQAVVAGKEMAVPQAAEADTSAGQEIAYRRSRADSLLRLDIEQRMDHQRRR